jgi:hypothetical protein
VSGASEAPDANNTEGREMKTINTEELGTIWTAKGGDSLTGVELGGSVRLASAHRRIRGIYIGRSWYLHGTAGTLNWTDGEIGESHDLCVQFLQDRGYKCVDEFAGDYEKS